MVSNSSFDNMFVRTGRAILTFLKYLSLCLASFISLIPVVSCILTSFKTAEEYKKTKVLELPVNWSFDSYVEAWNKGNMLLGFKNSFIVLICVLMGSIMIGTMIAYVLNRFVFTGNGLIRNLFLFATLIPGIATQITVYQIMISLNLVDSLFGYIILMMGTDVISIYIFIQFFENVSISLDESAIIDGASYYTVFFKILLPLLKPAIVTAMILKGIGTYNEYYMAMIYLQSDKLQTITKALYKFKGPFGSQFNYICAGVIISLIPALIIFILFQKQIYNGLTSGAVKG